MPRCCPRALGGAALIAAALLSAGCGAATHRHRSTPATRRAHPLDGAEPAVAPPLTTRPSGRIVRVGAGAEGIVAVPARGEVAVAVRDPDRIALLSTTTGDVTREIPIAGPARHLSLDGSDLLLVPEAPIDRLLELKLPASPTAPVERRSLVTGALPHEAAALDGRVFVGDEFGHAISVFAGRLASSRPLPALRGFTQPGGGVPDAGRIALVDVGADTVTLVDPHTLRIAGRLAVGRGLTHDAAGPDGRLYVADTRGGALLTVATRPRLRLLARTPLPDRPYGIASDPARGRLYVTQTGANRLVALDIAGPRPQIVASVPTVRQPNTVAVDPRTGRVYVAGAAAGVVQELPSLTCPSCAPPA